MKYIRTKNKILLVRNEDKSWYYVWDIRKKAYIVVSKKHIINQADTIEELCDGYVVRRYVMDEPCHWFYITKEKMKADISLRNSAYTIFGAIWTDKGLIYVAKMNEKGELELL